MTTKKPAHLVGIIGFGRFGPVLAKLVTPGHEVIAYDIVDIRERAGKAGVKVVTWEQIVQAQTLFLSVPISRLKALVADLVPVIKPGVTVFDVCSVKVYPTTVMEEHFPPGVTAIASHPLFGPDSSKEGFQDLPMVLHPVTERSAVFEYWLKYFSDRGIRVMEMKPEEHDRLAARTQGVTHFIGRVLQEYGIEATTIDTSGFEDLLLVVEQTCFDTIELFRDLENYNPYTMKMIDGLTNAMEKVKQSLSNPSS